MPRFIVNRCWAFILALALGFFAVAGATHPVAADTLSGFGYVEGGSSGDGGGGATIGDPDVPTTPGKGAATHGALTQPGRYDAVSVGGTNAQAHALMIRLQVVLRSLTMRWLGI